MNDHKVKNIVKNLSSVDSSDYFDEICLLLSRTIDADFVFIATINEDKTKATTISIANKGAIDKNFSYKLNHSPCAEVANESVCTYSCNIQHFYPLDQLLADMHIEGYVGVPLKNSQGGVQAVLVALFQKHISDVNEVETLFLLFSGLVEKELHKIHYLKTIGFSKNIIESTHEGIMVCDKNQQIIFINSSFTRITGYTKMDIYGKYPKILNSGKQNQIFYQDMWASINDAGYWQGEIWNRHKNGQEYLEWLSISAIFDENKEVTHYNAFITDITEQYQVKEKVKFQESYDILTKAPNKKMLFEFIEQSIVQLPVHVENPTSAALLIIDIDLFKNINRLYNHSFGDKVLINVANRLQSLVRDTDIVARTSGDNFALFINHLPDENAVLHIIKDINHEFLKPIDIGGISIKFTLSIGGAYYRKDALNAQGLFEKAEQAMFVAKDNGRNSYGFYSQHVSDEAKKQERLKIALESAISNDDFSVVYQPIVSLKNQSVTKFEALVRWNNKGTWVSPVEFIPAAEKFGLIKQIGEVVLSKACIALRDLNKQGYSDIIFNINRSIYEFPLKSEHNDLWLNTIKSYGLNPQSICFELTESVLAPENDSFIGVLNNLQTAGCTIALDDFGTGYSSLSYLRRFSVDTLKIDRSFIQDMTKEQDDFLLVSAIISMAKALNILVVAEGVEQKKEVNILTELGCDFIQGFYFSKPLVPERIVSYLNNFQYN